MDYDMLLFPVHKPQHWSLVVSISVLYYIYLWINNTGLQVVYLQSKEIHSIDSLNCSNEDAVNWIWWMGKFFVSKIILRMYMAIEVQYSSKTQLSSSDWKFSDVMVYIVPYAVMLNAHLSSLKTGGTDNPMQNNSQDCGVFVCFVRI